jgi:hypothetical protein
MLTSCFCSPSACLSHMNARQACYPAAQRPSPPWLVDGVLLCTDCLRDRCGHLLCKAPTAQRLPPENPHCFHSQTNNQSTCTLQTVYIRKPPTLSAGSTQLCCRRNLSILHCSPSSLPDSTVCKVPQEQSSDRSLLCLQRPQQMGKSGFVAAGSQSLCKAHSCLSLLSTAGQTRPCQVRAHFLAC